MSSLATFSEYVWLNGLVRIADHQAAQEARALQTAKPCDRRNRVRALARTLDYRAGIVARLDQLEAASTEACWL